MRPKKKVLVWCSDPDRAGRLAFVLRQGWEFAPTSCSTTEELAAALTARTYEGAIVIQATPVAAEMVKTHQPLCKVLAVGVATTPADMTHIDQFLPSDASMASLLEGLKVITVRKRGPRKGSPTAMICGMNGKGKKRVESEPSEVEKVA